MSMHYSLRRYAILIGFTTILLVQVSPTQATWLDYCSLVLQENSDPFERLGPFPNFAKRYKNREVARQQAEQLVTQYAKKSKDMQNWYPWSLDALTDPGYQGGLIFGIGVSKESVISFSGQLIHYDPLYIAYVNPLGIYQEISVTQIHALWVDPKYQGPLIRNHAIRELSYARKINILTTPATNPMVQLSHLSSHGRWNKVKKIDDLRLGMTVAGVMDTSQIEPPKNPPPITDDIPAWNGPRPTSTYFAGTLIRIYSIKEYDTVYALCCSP